MKLNRKHTSYYNKRQARDIVKKRYDNEHVEGHRSKDWVKNVDIRTRSWTLYISAHRYAELKREYRVRFARKTSDKSAIYARRRVILYDFFFLQRFWFYVSA